MIICMPIQHARGGDGTLIFHMNLVLLTNGRVICKIEDAAILTNQHCLVGLPKKNKKSVQWTTRVLLSFFSKSKQLLCYSFILTTDGATFDSFSNYHSLNPIYFSRMPQTCNDHNFDHDSCQYVINLLIGGDSMQCSIRACTFKRVCQLR